MSLEKIEARDRQGGGEMTLAEREAIGRVRAWSPTYQYQDIYVVLAALDKAEVEIARKDAVLNNISVKFPNDDGLVWLHLLGHGSTGTGMVNLGPKERIVAQVGLLFDADRRAALSPKDGAGE